MSNESDAVQIDLTPEYKWPKLGHDSVVSLQYYLQ